MDIGRVHLGRILKHGLQQFDDRRILRAGLDLDLAKVHGLAHVRAQFARQIGDLLGAPVNAVYGLDHLVLIDEDQFDVALEHAHDLVKSEQIGGIGHRHQVGVALVLKQQRAKPPCLRLGQHARHLQVDVVVREVEVGNFELLGPGLGDAVLGGEAVLDQHPASLRPLRFCCSRARFNCSWEMSFSWMSRLPKRISYGLAMYSSLSGHAGINH